MIKIYKQVVYALSLFLVTQFAYAFELSHSESIEVARRMSCSLKDNELTHSTWSGNAYSRIPGERDRLLFKVLGINTKYCISHTNKKNQKGYKWFARELMLYLDPETGKPLKTWKNPWTNKKVDVIHVANDPVNGENYGYDRSGKKIKPNFKDHGKVLSISYEIPLFYTNALGGNYQEYVGGKYHAMEIFNFLINKKDVKSKKPNIPFQIAWTRIAQWLPWMEMGGRSGIMVINATGNKLERYSDLDPILKKAIRKDYRIYSKAPPSTDKRKNDTSWTVFKRHLDEKGKK